MSRHAVLILFADALAAALVGAAVELAGHRPHFPQPEEAARAALRRTRPDVVLLNCDHEEALSESFIGPAMMTGARVLLVRSPRCERDVGMLATDMGLQTLELPIDMDSLRIALDGS